MAALIAWMLVVRVGEQKRCPSDQGRFLGLSTTWIVPRRWDKLPANRLTPALRRAAG
jgi:hypothetical protein